jgi:putative ABC transport system substrate-binding protein
MTFVARKIGAIVISTDLLFFGQMKRFAALAEEHKLPAIAPLREFVLAGGLMSYGASIPDAYRQAGVYAGRVLKGDKPADLPIMQPTIFDLAMNLRTAKALGLELPSMLLAIANEVIE